MNDAKTPQVSIARFPRRHMPALFGISDTHFNRLQRAGVFKPTEKGFYDLKSAIKAWADYHAAGQTDSTQAEERRLLTIAQRRRIEQEIRARDAELVELAEVRQFYLANVQALAGALDGLAGRLAHELAACSDPALVRAILLKEHRRVRETYANALEDSAAGKTGRRSAETAAGPDGLPVG